MQPKTTAKDFFLQLAIFVGLYVSVISFLVLSFAIIDRVFPLIGEYVYNPDGAIRSPLATLIIFFPAFLYVMSLGNKELIAHPEKKDLWIRRWAIYLTLFFAGLIIAIDLVTLVYRFLGAEDLTTRFFLKVAVVFIVALTVFKSIQIDLKRDDFTPTKRDMYVGGIVSIVVLSLIIYGFFLIGSPASQRARALDEQRVNDLTSIQNQIVYMEWQNRGEVPANLDSLKDPISGYMLPVDPETKELYTYKKLSKNSFELCANFKTVNETTLEISKPRYADVMMNSNWQHGATTTCFTRTIDEKLYPISTKGKI